MGFKSGTPMKLLSIPVIVLSLAATAAAESKVRLSQLDFDAVVTAKAQPQAAALSEIFDNKAEKAEPAVDESSARASLSTNPTVVAPIQLEPETQVHETGYSWQKPLDLAASYLRPALTGVDTDKNNPNSVQSSLSWNGSDAQSNATSCARAKAIKEVLNRYSGSDDFAAAQCTESCAKKGEKAVLTAFEVKEVNGVSSSIVQSGSNSQFKIAANGNIAAWPILEGASGYCSCLPTSCLR